MADEAVGCITACGVRAGRGMQKHIRTIGMEEFTGLMLRVGTISIQLNSPATSRLDAISIITIIAERDSTLLHKTMCNLS